MTHIVSALDHISDRYEAVLCDLWGCLHNGLTVFPGAVSALERFRDGGGIVLLLTNAPRPAPSVQQQLDLLGVDRRLYHGIVASGDAARASMVSGVYGERVHHIGAPKDEGFFQGLDTEDFYSGIDIKRVPMDQAESVVCTGLRDDLTETPADYVAELTQARDRGLRMLCANPDVVVDRGDQRLYCAGALAELYTELGGESIYTGKPHPPIYDLARRRLASIAGRTMDDSKILCIGDGIMTDIRGAISEDLDSLFIAGGLAAGTTMTAAGIDAAQLDRFFAGVQLTPTYAIGHLA